LISFRRAIAITDQNTLGGVGKTGAITPKNKQKDSGDKGKKKKKKKALDGRGSEGAGKGKRLAFVRTHTEGRGKPAFKQIGPRIQKGGAGKQRSGEAAGQVGTLPKAIRMGENIESDSDRSTKNLSCQRGQCDRQGEKKSKKQG